MNKIIWPLTLSIVMSGCKKTGPEKEAPASGAAPVRAEQPVGSPTTSPSAPASTPTPAPTTPPVSSTKGEVAIPASRSKVPTAAEWSSAPEIVVPGAAPLGCEGKRLREWLRVSCRGKTRTGGTPSHVEKRPGCPADSFTFVGADVTSYVGPVLPGSSCLVTFDFVSERMQNLKISWDKGEANPKISF